MDIKILGFRGNIDSVGKTLDKINNLKNNDEEIISNGEKAVLKSLKNLGLYTATAIRKKYDSTELVMQMCDAYKF